MLRLLYFITAFFILIHVSTDPVYGQNIPVLIENEAFVDDARQAIDSLYNRNGEAAKEILGPWMDQHPDHPLWDLWSGMELWWEVLHDLPSTRHDEEFFNRMKAADYEAGRLLGSSPDHPDALIVRAVSNAYSARHHSNRENWITSMNLGRRALQAHSRLLEVMPDLPDNDFAEGLKKYYSAYIPDNYPIVRAVSWFLPEGNLEEGQSSLRLASENGIFARPEAAYFLGYILLNYEEKYEEAAGIFENLVQYYPDNGYYRRLHVRALIQMGRYDEAREASLKAIERWESRGPGSDYYGVLREEIFHWLGRSYYHTGSYPEAMEAFINSYEAGINLPNRRDREFHTLSAYFAGRVHELLSNPAKAIEYYRAALRQTAGDQAMESARERLDRLR